MLSYNQIIERFRAFADAHYIIKGSFGTGEAWQIVEHNKLKNSKYPLMWVEDLPFPYSQNEVVYSFRVYFLAQVATLKNQTSTTLEQTNIVEVKSDMLQCAQDLLTFWVQDHVYDELDIDKATSAISFNQEFNDNLTGWYIDIKLEQAITYDVCAIPMDGVPAPEDPCLPVAIYEDGVLVATISSGGTYSYVTTSDPAGNTMNGTSLTDIVAGTTKAFTIRYADDSPVTVTTITDNATTFIGEVPNTVNPSVYYNRPYLLQTTSYNTYDEAWRKINGGNDYNDAIPDEAYKQQIQPDFVNGRYDYLKYFNKWGHKFRFTGENGGYYDEADGNYYDVNGNLSDLATEFPDISGSSWWIYDHLTGSRMPNKRGGAINWATALSSTQTYAFAGTVYDWLVWSPEECSQLNNYDTSDTGSLIATNRPFFNMSLTYFWTGRTVEVSITTAFRYNFAQELGAVDTQGKTNTSQIIYYFTVAETGTIPQP